MGVQQTVIPDGRLITDMDTGMDGDSGPDFCSIPDGHQGSDGYFRSYTHFGADDGRRVNAPRGERGEKKLLGQCGHGNQRIGNNQLGTRVTGNRLAHDKCTGLGLSGRFLKGRFQDKGQIGAGCSLQIGNAGNRDISRILKSGLNGLGKFLEGNGRGSLWWNAIHVVRFFLVPEVVRLGDWDLGDWAPGDLVLDGVVFVAFTFDDSSWT